MAVKSAHLPALDGLRGLAVVAVLAFHAGHLTGGYLGVDLFFVLSGFLITRILIADNESFGHIRLGRFYVRRIRRLAPALLLMVAFVALTFDGVRLDGLASVFYYSNWREVFSGTSYLAALDGPSPLEHTWSLSIEEQVYLGWPLLLIGALRLRRFQPASVVIGLASLIAGLSLVSNLINLGGSSSRLYYGTDVRVFAVMMGALVAGVEAKGWLRNRGWIAPVAGISLAAIALSILVVPVDGYWLHRGLLSGFGIGSALLITELASSKTGLIGTMLSFGPFRWIGNISYGLYLWHWPIFVLYDGLLVRFFLSFAVATTSYFIIEKPIRNGSTDGILLAAFSTSLAALTLLLMVSVPDQDGLSEFAGQDGQFGEMVVLRDGPAGEASALRAEMVGAVEGFEVPDTTEPSLTVVMALGDSQTLYLAGPARENPAYDYPIIAASSLGCGVGPGFPVSDNVAVTTDLIGQPCEEALTTWVTLLFDYQPDVVLIHAGAWDILDRQIDGSSVKFGTETWDEVTIQRFSDLNRVFGVDERRVVWMAAPCYAPVGSNGGPPERSNQERVRRWNELLRVAADDQGAYVLDYDRFVCGEGGDGPLVHDDAFRFDGVHLTNEGATQVWRWIDSQPDFFGETE